MIVLVIVVVALSLLSIFVSKKYKTEEKSFEKQLSEIYYGTFPMKVLTEEKYIKVNYETVVSMINSGIKLLYSDYYEIYYFYDDNYNDILNRDIIFCLTTIKDTKKIKSFLEDRKIASNESKEGYEYILRKISKYRREQEEEADKAFQNLQKNFSSPTIDGVNSLYVPPDSVKKDEYNNDPFINSCYYQYKVK